MPKTTIPETVEVPTDGLIEAIGFLFHLSSSRRDSQRAAIDRH
jgi:hypothetical protein